MIMNRLSLLLAERQLKITRVSNDTKISRTTLTSLMKNESRMIQLETINTLCLYLDVTPGDLLEFIPHNFSYHIEILEGLVYPPEEGPLTYQVEAFLNIEDSDSDKWYFEYNGHLVDYGGAFSLHLEPVSAEVADIADGFFSDLPQIFQTQIEKDFIEEVTNKIVEEFDALFKYCDVSLSLTSKKSN